jgi:hypothetical protein
MNIMACFYEIHLKVPRVFPVSLFIGFQVAILTLELEPLAESRIWSEKTARQPFMKCKMYILADISCIW